MKIKITKIHYFKWTGDPITAQNEFNNDDKVLVDFSGPYLVLKSGQKSIMVKRGLNIVSILNPQTMGWNYYRMSDEQLKQYINLANQGGHIVLD